MDPNLLTKMTREMSRLTNVLSDKKGQIVQAKRATPPTATAAQPTAGDMLAPELWTVDTVKMIQNQRAGQPYQPQGNRKFNFKPAQQEKKRTKWTPGCWICEDVNHFKANCPFKDEYEKQKRQQKQGVYQLNYQAGC